jgi:uncharacterized protein YjiS (DUF1127 family)
MSNSTAPSLHRSTLPSEPSAKRTRILAGAMRFSHTVGTWIARSRGRKALRQLVERNDPFLLQDIGVTREEALRKAAKWFWQP